MVEWTYHEVLSAVVNELLHPLLAVFTPHMRLYKHLHWAWLTSKRCSMQEKKCCKLNIFISNEKLINRYISFKLILPFASHVQQTEQSCQCAWSPNHEFAGSGCWHRTKSVLWTAQTSRAEYIAAIYPLRCMAVWNPSKL